MTLGNLAFVMFRTLLGDWQVPGFSLRADKDEVIRTLRMSHKTTLHAVLFDNNDYQMIFYHFLTHKLFHKRWFVICQGKRILELVSGTEFI